PLLNKAIQAQLAPGSVFKIIMAVAGTNEGIAQNLHVNCPGGGTFYGRYFKCWVVAEHRVHGAVDLTKAIYQSCDVFFYTLAERLGIEKIARWATALGIGKKTGIDLPNEASGVMPSEEWKMRTFRQKWYQGGRSCHHAHSIGASHCRHCDGWNTVSPTRGKAGRPPAGIQAARDL